MNVLRIKRLIYASRATAPMTREEVEAIATVAKGANAEVGITGFMAYDGRSFIQVIEGPWRAVDALFSRIRLDFRHQRVTLLYNQPTERRRFSQWRMGLLDLREFADASHNAADAVPCVDWLSLEPYDALEALEILAELEQEYRTTPSDRFAA